MSTLLYIIFLFCCVFGGVEQILLIRHGFKVEKPDPNPYETWNWRRSLSLKGEKEVKNDAEFLTQYIAEQYPGQNIADVVDVYASPFRRALQSASCFAASNRLKIKIDRAAGETEKTESHAIYRPLNFASGNKFLPVDDGMDLSTNDMDLSSITQCTDDNNRPSKSDGQQGPKCDIKIVETIRKCEIPNYPQDDPGTPLDIFDEVYSQQNDDPEWFGRNWKKLSDEENCVKDSCDPVGERVATLYNKFMASESKPVIILFAHGGINNDLITYMNKAENIGRAWNLDDFRIRIKFKKKVYKSASQPTGSIIFFKKIQDQWFPDGERYSYPKNENAFDGRLQGGCSAEVEAPDVRSHGYDMLYQGTEEVDEETFPKNGGSFSGGKVTNWKEITKDGVTLQAGAFTFVPSTRIGKCTLHFVLDTANPDREAEVTGYKGLWKPCLEAGRWIGPIGKKSATGYDENNSYLTGLPTITECEAHVAIGTYEAERRGSFITAGIGCILLCVIILFTLHRHRKNGSELSIYFLPHNEVHDLMATL